MATTTTTTIASSIFLTYLLSCSLFSLSLFSSFSRSYAYEEREILEKSRHNLHHSHVVVQLSSLLPSSVCNPSTKGTQDKRSSLKVVHRHGPCSKLNQDKPFASPDVTQILLHDQSRVDSIHSRVYNSPRDDLYDLAAATVPVKSGSIVNSGNYIVTVGIGTPKTDLSLIFDTGSGFTWTQCQPCAGFCHEQKDPIFAPSKSTSYANVSCNTALCTKLKSATGVTPGCSISACVYGIQYGDQSYSIGLLGKEKLTLGSTTEVFDNFYFGCGQNNQGLFGGSAGLLGLARDELSFVSQTAQKYGKYFSYCLPSTVSSTGYLSFGKGKGGKISSSVKFTPLVVNAQLPSFYFMNTLGISVGGKKLPISASIFSNAGMLIDSGTVISRLPPTAYTALRSAFQQLMSKYPSAVALSILDTCYDLSGYTSVTIPKISFFFGGGVEMVLDPSGILYAANKSQVCLAFAGNGDDSDVAIFGNVQQLTYNIVYDVAGGRLGFGPGGCH